MKYYYKYNFNFNFEIMISAGLSMQQNIHHKQEAHSYKV